MPPFWIQTKPFLGIFFQKSPQFSLMAAYSALPPEIVTSLMVGPLPRLSCEWLDLLGYTQMSGIFV